MKIRLKGDILSPEEKERKDEKGRIKAETEGRRSKSYFYVSVFFSCL